MLFNYTLDSREVVPINKTMFEIIHDDGNSEVVDLTGREFILITLREQHQ